MSLSNPQYVMVVLMRLLGIFFFSILSLKIHATEVNLKLVNIDYRPAYIIEVENFTHHNNALQLKFKLSAFIKEAMTIESVATGGYKLTIGPIRDYLLAKELQKKLNKDLLNNTNDLAMLHPLDIEKYGNNTVKELPGNINKQNIQEATVNNNLISVADIKSKKLKKSVHNGTKLWNLRNADIRAVITEVARVTGKNFIVDTRVQGKISIVSATPISNKELYQVFLSMLQVAGYAAIPSGEVIKIVPNIEARVQTEDLLSQLRSPPKGDEIMVAVVPVHHVAAEQLVPILRSLMPQWSQVSAYTPSNILILSGRANNIKHIIRIIREVDASSANGIDIVHLKHALAMDIVNTLKDLVKPQAANGGQHVQPILAADDRSNTILLSGVKTDRIKLRLLIAKLDKEITNGSNSNTQVVYLNYLRAEDLVPILAGIAQANFSGTVGTTIGTITRPQLDSTNPASSLVNNNSASGNESPAASNAATNANATPNTTGTATQIEGSTKPNIQIIAEPNTNSIILNAPYAIIRILKTVINQLDIKPAQLLIEALVAEIDEKDLTSLGIEWGFDRNPTKLNSFKVGSFQPGFAIINSKTRIKNFQAQIYALAQDRRANILSTPSVVVLDNRQAKILVGKQVSVASTSYPNNANGTTTASPFVTFDRVNVALHLYVRPQITRDNGIELQIDEGNDTIDPASILNSNNPVFKISSIVTSVHIDSGDIVVLGGLTQDSLGANDTRIPILGDIPGIGRLFQHNLQDREKRVLMVFIRTCILSHRDDALYVSGTKYAALRQEQLNFLRTQPYNPNNEKMLLVPQKQAILPKPFSLSSANNK